MTMDDVYSKLHKKLEEEKKKELSAMRAEILEKTAKMEEIYNSNCDKWVDNIVDSIVKE